MAFQWASILSLCLASLVSGQDCTLGEVRLVDDGGSLSERNTGLVQICDNQNNWKRVCYYFSWKDNLYSHNLVCSQLGYENHGAVSVRFSGSQTSSETAVSCMGNEPTVAHCSLSMENCYWHARLTCIKVNCTNGEITLSSGPTYREGRVEVCVDGRWGTVCGEGWGDTEAGLVCARLGFPREGTMITQYSQGTLQSIYTLTCSSTESDPPNCTATPASDSCDHSMDLGVRCLTYQEISKRDSTNLNQLTGELITSSKTLGALTGLLTVALVVVGMGWIVSCVYWQRRFKHKDSTIKTNTDLTSRQLDNPVYGGSTADGTHSQTNYSSTGPAYEHVEANEGTGYDVINRRGAPRPHPPMTPPGSHDPTSDQDYSILEENNYHVLESSNMTDEA